MLSGITYRIRHCIRWTRHLIKWLLIDTILAVVIMCGSFIILGESIPMPITAQDIGDFFLVGSMCVVIKGCFNISRNKIPKGLLKYDYNYVRQPKTKRKRRSSPDRADQAVKNISDTICRKLDPYSTENRTRIAQIDEEEYEEQAYTRKYNESQANMWRNNADHSQPGTYYGNHAEAEAEHYENLLK